MRVVVALGGNAMTGPDSSVLPDHQIAAVTVAAAQIARLVAAGHEVLVSHGNGPQVGNLLAKNDLAGGRATPVPLDWCVASTQGTLGFILLDALDTALAAAGLDVRPAVVLSRTVVDPRDPAFDAPTKPIGRYADEQTAWLRQEAGQHWREITPGRWRRVVASPDPVEIVDTTSVGALLDAGFLVVAGGGGGIPVVRGEDGALTGIEAVVDKDLSSVLLARQVDADVLVIATDVENAWLDWGSDRARPLHRVPLEELRGYVADGHFAVGSMGPKVTAVLRFVDGGGMRGVITSLDAIVEAVDGDVGTVVVP